jgi:hypothetical protein
MYIYAQTEAREHVHTYMGPQVILAGQIDRCAVFLDFLDAI